MTLRLWQICTPGGMVAMLDVGDYVLYMAKYKFF